MVGPDTGSPWRDKHVTKHPHGSTGDETARYSVAAGGNIRVIPRTYSHYVGANFGDYAECEVARDSLFRESFPGIERLMDRCRYRVKSGRVSTGRLLYGGILCFT